MIRIEEADVRDADTFATMEQSEDTKEFIIPYDSSGHAQKIAGTNHIYLRILKNGELVGFFILALDADDESIEFRRIVVFDKGCGIGQDAIREMEAFCRNRLNRNRIWLDVFEFNKRGIHIYEKLGYVQFGKSTHEGKRLRLYEKNL